MKVTMIPIVVGAFGMVSKSLGMGIRGRTATIQTTALLKFAWIFRVQETCCHLYFREKPPVKTGVKNSKGLKNNNILHLYISFRSLDKTSFEIKVSKNF